MTATRRPSAGGSRGSVGETHPRPGFCGGALHGALALVLSSLCVGGAQADATDEGRPSVEGEATRAPETAEAMAARLGDAIEDSTAPSERDVDFGQSRVVVDRPLAEVLRVVTDYDRYDTFMPRFRESRVLSRQGDRAMIYIEATIMRGAHTLWAQMRIAPGRDEGETKVIEARMVRGNMDAFIARWRLTPVRDGSATLVRFDMLVDLDLPFSSSFLTGENVKSAHKAVWALRRRVLGVR